MRYAWRHGEIKGEMYFFEVSSGYAEWFVLPSFGDSLEEARTRLEATMHILGVGHLVERKSGKMSGRLGFPVCACGRLMERRCLFLWRRVAYWRCSFQECRRKLWTLQIDGHKPPEPATILGAGTPYDISDSFYHRGC